MLYNEYNQNAPQVISEMCGIFFQYANCHYNRTSKWNWILKIDGDMPPCVMQKEPDELLNDIIKVIQLSDIHLQENYSEDSNANCSDVQTCCQSYQVGCCFDCIQSRCSNKNFKSWFSF